MQALPRAARTLAGVARRRRLSRVVARRARRLVYVSGRKFFSVAVSSAEHVHARLAAVRDSADIVAGNESRVDYDVAADGRFLVVRKTSHDAFDRHVNVVLGWGASVREATSAKR